MEQLFTPESLANYLGLSRQTIYNRHSIGGDLPAVIKIGRMIRFHPSDVECWLELQRHKQEPISPSVGNASKRRGRPTKAEQISARVNKCIQ